jgi:hypothetical protein
MGMMCCTHGRLVHTRFWQESQKERDHGISRCRWEDNIKMGLRGMGWCGMNLGQ